MKSKSFKSIFVFFLWILLVLEIFLCLIWMKPSAGSSTSTTHGNSEGHPSSAPLSVGPPPQLEPPNPPTNSETRPSSVPDLPSSVRPQLSPPGPSEAPRGEGHGQRGGREGRDPEGHVIRFPKP